MIIALANISELTAIFDIYIECKKSMDLSGIFQWTELYPDKSVIERDIESRELFTIKENDVILGAIVINKDEDPQYHKVNWKDNLGPTIIIHRLAIHPLHQNKGLAKGLMKYAEDLAHGNKIRSIRLDAYSGNPAAIRLYENLHYEKRGELYFREIFIPFYCYEKMLPMV